MSAPRYDHAERERRAAAIVAHPDGCCEWFALCGRPAVRVLDHPILHAVPACAQCAARVEDDRSDTGDA
jgi:hypothetical protein